METTGTTPTNPMNEIFETQRKVAETWFEAAKSMTTAATEPFTKGFQGSSKSSSEANGSAAHSANGSQDPAAENAPFARFPVLFTEWADKQRELILKHFPAANNPADFALKPEAAQAAFQNSPEFWKEWMEAQAEFNQKALETWKQSTAKMNAGTAFNWPNFGADAEANPFAKWASASQNPFAAFNQPFANPFAGQFGGQNNPWAAWMNGAGQANPFGQAFGQAFNQPFQNPFTQSFQSFMNPATWAQNMQSPQEFSARMMEEWKKWSEESTKWASDNFGSFIPSGTAGQFQNTMKAYMEMMKDWTSVYENSGGPAFQNPADWMNADKYRKLIDLMMGQPGPEAIQSVADAAKRSFEQMAVSVMRAQQPYATAQQDFWNRALDAGKMGENLAAFGLASQMVERMQRFYLPFLHLLPAGQYKEVMENLRAAQVEFAEYTAKTTETQQLIYKASQEALREAGNEYFEKVKSADAKPDFDGFFKHWIDLLDKRLTTLFSGDEYAQLFGESAKYGAALRARMETIAEKFSTHAPFMIKREGDEIALQLSELNRRLYTLEKEREEPVSESAAKPAAKAKTTAQPAAQPAPQTATVNGEARK